MNLYKPYTVIEDSEQRLHLAESRGRRRFLFVFFRVFPVLLIALQSVAWLALSESDRGFPLWMTVSGSVLTLFIVLVLLAGKYILEVSVEKSGFTITERTFSGPRTNSIPTSACRRITLYISGGRGGGSFFRIELENGRKQALITIPILFMDRAKSMQIAEKLKNLTGLPVEEI